MNTNMLNPAKLMLIDENGNEIKLNGTIEFEELNTNSISEIDPYKNISVNEYSMHVNIENSMKLTKKKLIKLLMSKGIQRNGANEIAKYLLKKNGKYTMFDLMMW